MIHTRPAGSSASSVKQQSEERRKKVRVSDTPAATRGGNNRVPVNKGSSKGRSRRADIISGMYIRAVLGRLSLHARNIDYVRRGRIKGWRVKLRWRA